MQVMEYKKRLADGLILIAWIVLIAWCCSGCKIGEKAVNKYKHSSEFPKDCADEFPVKTDTVVIDGELRVDSAVHYEYVQVPVPGENSIIERLTTKTITVTKHRRDTIRVTVEDTRRVEQYKRVLDEQAEKHIKKVAGLESDLKAANRKVKTRSLQRNISWGLIALFIGWSFRSRITKLIK